eukprot:4655846-Amphidinium_carterae.1
MGVRNLPSAALARTLTPWLERITLRRKSLNYLVRISPFLVARHCSRTFSRRCQNPKVNEILTPQNPPNPPTKLKILR